MKQNNIAKHSVHGLCMTFMT